MEIIFTLKIRQYYIYHLHALFFTDLKLCLATATHNFKSVKNTHVCLNWDQAFRNFDVLTLAVIWSAHKTN